MKPVVSHIPLVSVLVPVYGVEKYIAAFAESLLGQTYTDIEFVIVNDGTTDRSMDIFREILASRFPHLTDMVHIYDKENGGLPSARKFGIEHCSGDYILFADSDDRMEPDMVSKLVERAQETGSDITYCDFFCESPGKTTVKTTPDYGDGQSALWMDDFFGFSHKTSTYLWRCLFKAGLLRNRELVFPEYPMGEDAFLFFQILESAETLSHLKTPLYHYRLRGDSIAHTKSSGNVNRQEKTLNFLALRTIFENRGYRIMSGQVKRDIAAYACWTFFKYDRIFLSSHPELARECISTLFGKGHSRLPFSKRLILKAYLLYQYGNS